MVRPLGILAPPSGKDEADDRFILPLGHLVRPDGSVCQPGVLQRINQLSCEWEEEEEAEEGWRTSGFEESEVVGGWRR